MHIFKPRVALEIATNERIETEEYLAPDVMAAQLLLMADGGEMRPLVREDYWWAYDDHIFASIATLAPQTSPVKPDEAIGDWSEKKSSSSAPAASAISYCSRQSCVK